MKKLFDIFKSGIFRAFFMPMTGLFFVILGLVMLLFLRNVSEKTRSEEERILENKLYTIAADMDNQISNMKMLVMKISNQKKLHPDYLNGNKYREKEAVDMLISSYNTSSIAENYFIMHVDYDKIFTSDGTTLSSVDYLFFKYELEEKEILRGLLEQVSGNETKGVYVHHDGDIALILFPLHAYSNVNKLHGTVGFVISVPQVEKRIAELVGSIDGAVSIYYGKDCLYEMDTEELVKTDSDYLLFSRKMKDIQVYAKVSEEAFFSWENIFSYREITLFVAMLVFLMLCTYMVAWKNSVPVHKILEKHFSSEKERYLRDWYSVTWNDIDRMIESLLYERKSSIGQLEMQMRALREQAIWLIVTGGYSDNLQSRLSLLNIKLGFPVFGIIKSDLKKDSIADEECETIRESIEELSESEMQLYTYWNESGKLDILVMTEEEYHLEVSVEMLQSLFETMGKSIELEVSIKCRDLESLHRLYRKNYRENTPQIQECLEVNEESRNIGKSQRTVKQVIEYINCNCCDYDLTLEKVALEFRITTPYLCTILKQEIGMSYKEYLTRLRICEACKLLREEDISVADICCKVGYVNVSYFIKLFQKHTGMTPNRYRVEHHEKNICKK